MKKILTRFRLGLIANVLLLTSVMSVVPQRAIAAPGVIEFQGIGGLITCNAMIGQGVVAEDQLSGNIPISVQMYESFYPGFPSGTRSSSMEAEAGDETSPLYKIGQKIFNNESVIYIYLTGVNTANNDQCASHGFFVQSPDSPNTFVGSGLRSVTSDNPSYTLLEGEYSKDTKSFRFNNGTQGEPGPFYEIKNSDSSTASHGSFTSPTSGGGGGSVSTGPCAGIPGGSALNACMELRFQNFTTLTFRDETYVLDSWGGGDSMRYKLISSYDPARDTENTKSGQQPYFEFATGGGDGAPGSNGQLDVDIDDDGGDKEIDGFIEVMNSLPASFTGGKYVDYDTTGNEKPHTYFASNDGTPTFNSVENMRRMLRYFPAEKKVAFLMGFNPSGNEQDVAGLVFSQVGETNSFETAPLNGCTGNEGKAVVDVDGDLASINSNSWRNAKLTLPKENCSSSHTALNVVLTAASAGQTVDNASTAGTDPATTDEDEESARTCTTEVNFLGWILCPVLSILDEATKWLENQIAGFLFVDPGTFDRDGGIYAAWSTFRGIATVIIVIIALMMIFSQAMGAGPFDNYSVKKLLPRLLIAGIGIQLSWFLLVQLINIFNILGDGIGNLLLNPFGLNTNTELGDILGTITREADFGDFVLGFAAMAAIVPAFIGGFVGLAIGVLGAVMVGFITLIVRDMIIFLGVVLAPIAIAMSVLPGTQKTSKWWWESLEKALMMYPLVIALLATGKIVGSLLLAAATPDGDDGIKITYVIAAIIAWYAPFFFLPKALQAGGAALGKISGLAGDKSKGLIGKMNDWNTSRKGVKSKHKEANRNMRLGSDSWGARAMRPFDRIASGSVGGLRRGTRAAYGRENQRKIEEGLKEELERRRIAAGLGVTGARNQLAGFNEQIEVEKLEAQRLEVQGGNDARDAYRTRTGQSLDIDQAELKVEQVRANAERYDVDAARAEMRSKEAKLAADQASVALAGSMGANWNNPADVRAEFAVATAAGDTNRQQAILNRLVTLGADQDMRQLLSSGTIPAEMESSLRQSGDFVGAFKDKAPDLIKGGGAFDTLPPAQKMHDWSKDTLELALSHNGGANIPEIKRLAEEDPDFAASLDAKKRTSLESVAGPIVYAKKATG